MVSRTPSRGNPAAGPRPAFDTRDVFRVLFRHQRKMLLFFCATMGLAVLAVIFLPRTYTSDARLFVRLGKESVALDPTASLNSTVPVNESRESEINSELEILRSRVLLEDVVERLGADTVLHNASSGEGASWTSVLLAPVDIARTWVHGNVSAEERAVRELEKTVSVSSPRKSNVILLQAKGRDPKHAQQILQSFVDAYMIRHVSANHTHGSHEFFVDQSKVLAEQLQRATDELRDAKNQIGLVSLEGHRTNVQSQATSIEAAILENERVLAHSEARVAALKKSLEELPVELMSEETVLPNAAADSMRSELYRLQIEEKAASSKFTAKHPQVIALRQQVAETQKILDEQVANRSHTTKKLSTVHQSVQTELLAAQAQAAAYRAEAESLGQQYDGIKARINTLNNNEFRITELERQVDSLEVSYREYLALREKARMNSALHADQISNVNVVQPASYVAKATSPRVMITLIAGFLLAGFGAVGLAFVCEYFDPSLKTSEEIENELGIPVLFAVPRNDRHAVLSN